MNKAEYIAAINKIDPNVKPSEDHTVAQLAAMHKGLTSDDTVKQLKESSDETIKQLTESLEETATKVASLEKATAGTIHTFEHKKKTYQVIGGARFRNAEGISTKMSAEEIAANKEVRTSLVEKGSGLVTELS